jgi:membrane-associated phospholipid phosphatase
MRCRRLAAFAALSLLAPALRAAELPTLSDQAAAKVAAADSSYSLSPEQGGDGRRTTSRFVKNLGRNIVGVFSKDNFGTFALGAAATSSAFMFDDEAQTLMRDKAEELGEFGQSAGSFKTIVPLTVGLFVTGRASTDSRFRAATYDIAQATIVSGLYTDILKRTVARPRPDASDTRSFPSGHTSNAFAWASVASHHYGPKVGIPAYALAGFIGVSRMERDKHHLSDVLAGATIGLIAGRTVTREDGEAVRPKKRLSIVPMTDPQGGGAGAGLHFEF